MAAKQDRLNVLSGGGVHYVTDERTDERTDGRTNGRTNGLTAR